MAEKKVSEKPSDVSDLSISCRLKGETAAEFSRVLEEHGGTVSDLARDLIARGIATGPDDELLRMLRQLLRGEKRHRRLATEVARIHNNMATLAIVFLVEVLDYSPEKAREWVRTTLS